MKANRLNLRLAFSLLVAAGCGGARTPLDELESAQPGGPVGGAIQGGDTGLVFGGSLATGGVVGTAGVIGFAGATVGTGGVIALGGGTGGFVPYGGTAEVGGYIAPTGATRYVPPTGGAIYLGGSGGTVPVGGTAVGGRSTVFGGSFGTTGGTTGVGGRGGTGGFFPFGGTTVLGGSTGGTIPLGGTAVGGSGGTIPLGGTAVGGHSGTLATGGTVVGGRGGTASTGGVGGSVGGTTCPGLAPNEELIDDMNDGDRFIPQVNGRAGAWKDSDDGTPGATMFPDPAGLFTMTKTGDMCRQYAAYVYGGPFVDTGATVGFGIGGPYDASKYDGISFWAKIDSGSYGLRVAFPDKDTLPDGGLCEGSAPENQCWDHYGYRITNRTTEWTKYTVSFSSLTQDGWGRSGGGFDPSTLFEVQFQIPKNNTFGVWIDDVAFVIGTSN